jgi:hypothetical protein
MGPWFFGLSKLGHYVFICMVNFIGMICVSELIVLGAHGLCVLGGLGPFCGGEA